MTVYVIIHTTVDDTEIHHREIVPKIMRTVARHGGKRIALGHGEQLRVSTSASRPTPIAWSFTSFPASRPSRPGSRISRPIASSSTPSAT